MPSPPNTGSSVFEAASGTGTSPPKLGSPVFAAGSGTPKTGGSVFAAVSGTGTFPSQLGGPVFTAGSGTGMSVPTPPKTGGPIAVAASGAGPSLPPPPPPERSSTLRVSSQDLGTGSAAGGSGYGTRPKGRPTYVPQWARPDGGDGPPPPPPPTSLPSWAIIPGPESTDAPRQASGTSTSGSRRNTDEAVPPQTSGSQRSTDDAVLPHNSGVPTSDQRRNTVDTGASRTSGAPTSDQRMNSADTVSSRTSGASTSDQRRNSSDTARPRGGRVLQRFSPPVVVSGSSTKGPPPSESVRGRSPPVKKMPTPRSARPAPASESSTSGKKRRRHEPVGTSDLPSSSSSMREFQGSMQSSNIFREAQVLVLSSGSEQITAVNVSGLAGGAQSVRLKKAGTNLSDTHPWRKLKSVGISNNSWRSAVRATSHLLRSSKLGTLPASFQVRTFGSDRPSPGHECWRVLCSYTGHSIWQNHGHA